MFTFWLVILLSTDPGAMFSVIKTYKTMDECQTDLKKSPPEHVRQMGCLAIALTTMKEV
jgi:hypothetical protein